MIYTFCTFLVMSNDESYSTFPKCYHYKHSLKFHVWDNFTCKPGHIVTIKNAHNQSDRKICAGLNTDSVIDRKHLAFSYKTCVSNRRGHKSRFLLASVYGRLQRVETTHLHNWQHRNHSTSTGTIFLSQVKSMSPRSARYYHFFLYIYYFFQVKKRMNV